MSSSLLTRLAQTVRDYINEIVSLLEYGLYNGSNLFSKFQSAERFTEATEEFCCGQND
jgi:hypothetical protein